MKRGVKDGFIITDFTGNSIACMVFNRKLSSYSKHTSSRMIKELKARAATKILYRFLSLNTTKSNEHFLRKKKQ